MRLFRVYGDEMILLKRKILVTLAVCLVCVFLMAMSYNFNFMPLWFYSKINELFMDPEIGPYYNKKVSMHLAVDSKISDGSIVFIGDSIIQSLPVYSITEKGLNLGIGGDTTVGVLNRISKYGVVERAGAIVIMVGINDIPIRSNEEIIENYRKIAKLLPDDIPIYFSSILPVDEKVENRRQNARIDKLNSALNSMCSRYDNFFFTDTASGLKDHKSGNLKSECHKGDGLHLNELGYKKLIVSLSVILDD